MDTDLHSQRRLFPKIATAILATFMGIMLLVTIIAYSRPSGSTRQDMAQAQLLRKQVEAKVHHPSSP